MAPSIGSGSGSTCQIWQHISIKRLQQQNKIKVFQYYQIVAAKYSFFSLIVSSIQSQIQDISREDSEDGVRAPAYASSTGADMCNIDRYCD